jgi:hypothetical protein
MTLFFWRPADDSLGLKSKRLITLVTAVSMTPLALGCALRAVDAVAHRGRQGLSCDLLSTPCSRDLNLAQKEKGAPGKRKRACRSCSVVAQTNILCHSSNKKNKKIDYALLSFTLFHFHARANALALFFYPHLHTHTHTHTHIHLSFCHSLCQPLPSRSLVCHNHPCLMDKETTAKNTYPLQTMDSTSSRKGDPLEPLP